MPDYFHISALDVSDKPHLKCIELWGGFVARATGTYWWYAGIRLQKSLHPEQKCFPEIFFRVTFLSAGICKASSALYQHCFTENAHEY